MARNGRLYQEDRSLSLAGTLVSLVPLSTTLAAASHFSQSSEQSHMKVYLDNCSFNRPFDDQSHIRIRLEAEAKLFIQSLIKDGKLELIWSYILDIENNHNPFQEKRNAIEKWKSISVIDVNESGLIINRARELVDLGVKSKDALHVASAIEGKAKYFVTTDDKLINKMQYLEEISVLNPITLAGYLDENDN